MDAVGLAEVMQLGWCPPLAPGTGPVVTGRFVHQAGANVIRLWLDGQAEPTGVTRHHPYWSVDRQAVIEAGELEVGELLDTELGLRRVAAVAPYEYHGLVYNLETTEHVYRVGTAGTLVHNCSVRNPFGQNAARMRIERPILRGERIDDIVDEVKRRTFATGNEHAVVRLADGRRVLVSGGPGGIDFAPGEVQRVFLHSHPYHLPATGPSQADYLALRGLGQRHSYLLERGLLQRFDAK